MSIIRANGHDHTNDGAEDQAAASATQGGRGRALTEMIGRLDIEPFEGVLELHVSKEMLRFYYGGDTLDDGRIRLQQVEGRSYVEVTAGAEHLDLLPEFDRVANP